MRCGVLYISYTGMLEPLGQSQVLAYQELLARDHPVHLISFERSEDWARAEERAAVGKRMAKARICWHPLRYHRGSTLGTAWDILRGFLLSWHLVCAHRLAVVHARSYVPSVVALMIKRVTRAKYVFDMRGFWADERVDGGLWPRAGRMYRAAKWFERRFLLRADHIVSLTHAAVREMRQFEYLRLRMPPVTVIPTCADLTKFVPGGAIADGFVFGYVGSAGTWYLFDSVVACFTQLLELRPEATFLIVNRGEHGYIRSRLASGGVSLDRVELRAADHSEMPAQMSRMHAAVFFIKPAFSKQASAPTKLGELLGCGVPCLGNSGVGDMAEVLEGGHVGVALADLDAESMADGLRRLIALTAQPDIRSRCVAVAQLNFSLDEGVARYRDVYSALEEA